MPSTPITKYTDRETFLADLSKGTDARLPVVMPNMMGVCAMVISDHPIVSVDFAGPTDLEIISGKGAVVWGSLVMAEEDQVLNLIQSLTNAYMASWKKSPS